MENVFKEGDRVYLYTLGWGTIKELGVFFIVIKFDIFDDDRHIGGGLTELISFTEYTLEGFSQERPEPAPKLGDIVWGKGFHTTDWSIGHYLGKQHASYKISSTPNALSYWLADKITTKNPYANEQ